MSFCPSVINKGVGFYLPSLGEGRGVLVTPRRGIDISAPGSTRGERMLLGYAPEGGKRITAQQFRRICYPPAWSMRIYYPINDEEPTPALPKGGSYTFRRICYPPEQKEPSIRGAPSPLPWGNRRSRFACRRKATGRRALLG